MKLHTDKHIRAAIKYAISNGWVFTKGGKASHCFGTLRCGDAKHPSCTMSIWSTPRNTENHAKQIIRLVDKCQ